MSGEKKMPQFVAWVVLVICVAIGVSLGGALGGALNAVAFGVTFGITFGVAYGLIGLRKKKSYLTSRDNTPHIN